MAQSCYDYLIGGANSGKERQCRLCGTRCRATRNVFGPTGFVSAMAKRFTYHDELVCPHTDEAWHEQGLRLALSINETPSKRVAELMRADLEDLLHENLH